MFLNIDECPCIIKGNLIEASKRFLLTLQEPCIIRVIPKGLEEVSLDFARALVLSRGTRMALVLSRGTRMALVLSRGTRMALVLSRGTRMALVLSRGTRMALRDYPDYTGPRRGYHDRTRPYGFLLTM
jgi:hypothetical protein